MNYVLIANGRLLAGSDEAASLDQIMRITRLSEEKVREKLLSGRRTKLTSSADQEKITKIYHALREAGLDIDMIPVEDAPAKPVPSPDSSARPSSVPPVSPEAKRKPSGWKRGVAVSLVLLLIAAAGVGGYAWYWLHRPLPPEVVAAENALFDGELVAIGVVDIKKLAAIDTYWFGGFDPDALPLDAQKRSLLDDLFAGPAGLRENLRHVLVSLSLPPEAKRGSRLVLLSGRFEASTLLASLGKYFKTEKVASDSWVISQKRVPGKEPLCKKDVPVKPESYYLRISPAWMMVASDKPHGDKIWQRLQSGAAAAQDTALWRAYRASRLLSVMALVPADAGKAIGGLPGMMAAGAASKVPHVKAVGVAVDVDPLAGGVDAGFHVLSEDSAWNSESASAIRQKVETMAQDGRSVSPTLAAVLSRVSVVGGPDALDIHLRLDRQVFGELEQVVQEGLGSLFTVTVSNRSGQKPAERINEHPQQYANLNLSELPPYKDKYQSEPPLFSDGAFSADLKSIKAKSDGVLEIWLEGDVGLPDNKDGRFNHRGTLSMRVTSVQDEAGRELLRDERCMGMNELGGRSPNQEEESSTNHNQDHGWVWKYVRLNPGVAVDQIHSIKGTMNFSLPTRVRRFEVPLKAGTVVEHAGLRFYLSSIKDDSVSYQVSGKNERLLEVRALNKDGRVLQRGWRVSDSNSMRISQSYTGEVRALEIYVAEQYFRRNTNFALNDLFRMSQKKDQGSKPQWFAPGKIDLKQWRDYSRLDLKKLKIDPKKDWGLWNGDVTPIAEGSWAPVRVFVTHTPKQWGNNPMAQLYFPQLKALPGVLSAISYRIDDPAEKEGPTVHYHKAGYWYNSKSGEVVVKHALNGRPIALNSITLATGLAANQKLNRLKGEFIFRLPQRTRSTKLFLSDLWKGKTVDGITVTIQNVSRGSFPGYELKIAGKIDMLVNLHGLSSKGERVIASPVNFQDGGYWTMTLPFGLGIKEVELVTATAQKVIRYPFDFNPAYPTK